MKERILKLLSESEPMKNAEIAKSLKVDVKEVTKLTKSMKKDGSIISPKRCYYSVITDEKKETVSKKEFIALYKKAGSFKTKKEAENNLNSFMTLVENLLASGKEVNFTGWGKFKVVNREERNGTNPQTRKKIVIPAKKVIKFKAGKSFDEKVNK